MKKDYEKIINEQKSYIQTLESMFNRACVEIANQKNIFEQTNAKIEQLNKNVDSLLNFLINSENNFEKSHISLQEYLKSFNIKSQKDLIFGINIEQKFIKNSSIPTLQYHLYQNNCFIQEKIPLYGLISKTKRDLLTIGKTFYKYIELCFKKKKEEIIGIIYLTQVDKEIFLDYYGNKDIQEESQNFIKIYMQEESLENLLL
ncbi:MULTISPECIES: hypothetical protein [unclassified Helicobacter]|uniref:hypothetical protein n=1 Tax=unclassified Helicobacter TaxID=2593540 RepID=UPI001315458B|nr:MULTISPECIES: hypothetical protein [unclassified Helicobacter]